jgi:predicted transcriptional regulator/transcriptional regulator with XRE-family HTH domain
MRAKLFLGPKIRELREQRGWKLKTCAEKIGVSVSYLSQIETNQRPISSRVVQRMLQTLEVDPSEFEPGSEQRLMADLREACASAAAFDTIPLSEIRRAAATTPRLAREFLDLHRAYRQADDRLKLVDEAMSVDPTASVSRLLPYEEVRDFFHYKDNHIHALDVAAEALADELALTPGTGLEPALESHLKRRLRVSVDRAFEPGLMRAFDNSRNVLQINAALPVETRVFQMAAHLAGTLLSDLIEDELARARLSGPSAADVCRLGLTNYAAGALLMPYQRFAQAARDFRHDIERLAQAFGASLEQVCHRLSNLQRPGERGVPIYFLRMDPAGNITKRHSATRLHFARFGGTCPVWNVHEAWSTPDQFSIKVVEMPDGVRYLSVARSVLKPSGSFSKAGRRYVLGFGCELQHAEALVYGDAVDLKAPSTPIGVSCRICERPHCIQRAFPPLGRQIAVPPGRRSIVPFDLAKS